MVDRVTPGWAFVHIGFEGDDVEIRGVNPWKAKWVPRLFQITVAHPSYPAQRHTMWTYEIPGPDSIVVFAAGEFSNGVWGFYEPV